MTRRLPSTLRCAAMIVAAYLATGGTALAADPFTVHEWGTFTSVVGSDGQMLSGLQLEEHGLPLFVHSHEGFAPRNKGWVRPVKGVTVKMETPVIYFYSDIERRVRVEVGFRGGSISQWYPQRIDGERLPPGPRQRSDIARMVPVDFSRGDYQGSAVWDLEVLPPDREFMVPAEMRRQETAQWPRARVPGANAVRNSDGQTEGFVFYRGIGTFALPLRVEAAADETLTLTNTGSDPLPFVWVYRKSAGATLSWTGSLAGRESKLAGPLQDIAVPFRTALVKAGLTAAEAGALAHTWQESYFDHPGLRVFWIVPRALTDEILPIEITPRPDVLERVLVGRTEVLTPKFESQLVRDFATDGAKRWQSDRYWLAYRERARQLSGPGTVAGGQVAGQGNYVPR